MTRTIKLPFEGFYNSSHDAILDDALESLTQDDHGNQPDDAPQLSDGINWQKVHEAYVIEYVKAFKQALELPLESLTFEELTSPKYYNYETDKIFCTISEADLKTLSNSVNQGALAEKIKEQCTNQSGFISFYSNDVLEWLKKPLNEWDHNEVAILLEAWIKQEQIDLDPYSLMDTARGNGVLDNILLNNMKPEGLALLNA
jgi:hypothetical protein